MYALIQGAVEHDVILIVAVSVEIQIVKTHNLLHFPVMLQTSSFTAGVILIQFRGHSMMQYEKILCMSSHFQSPTTEWVVNRTNSVA